MTTDFSPQFFAAPRPLRDLIRAHERAHLRQRRVSPGLPRILSRNPVYRQMLECDAAMASLAIVAGREPLFTLPDDPRTTAHWGPAGHYWTSLCVMLTAGLPFEQARRRAFFCQMPDQVLEFDAIAAAVDLTTVLGTSPAELMSKPATPVDQRRSAELVVTEGYSLPIAPGINYPLVPRIAQTLPWESSASYGERRAHAIQVSKGLHCLTGRLGSDEVKFRSDNARQFGRDPVRFGLALHCFGDSYSHQVDQAQYDAWQTKVNVVTSVSVPAGIAIRQVPMSKPGYMYPPLSGHGPAGHAPDDLREHQSQYLSYVGALYDLVTEVFGGGSPLHRGRLIAGLRVISSMKFDGDDEKINAQQSAEIRAHCSKLGFASSGLNDYLPEYEKCSYWRLFHRGHDRMMRPEGADAIFRTAREVGEIWSKV